MMKNLYRANRAVDVDKKQCWVYSVYYRSKECFSDVYGFPLMLPLIFPMIFHIFTRGGTLQPGPLGARGRHCGGPLNPQHGPMVDGDDTWNHDALGTQLWYWYHRITTCIGISKRGCLSFGRGLATLVVDLLMAWEWLFNDLSTTYYDCWPILVLNMLLLVMGCGERPMINTHKLSCENIALCERDGHFMAKLSSSVQSFHSLFTMEIFRAVSVGVGLSWDVLSVGVGWVPCKLDESTHSVLKAWSRFVATCKQLQTTVEMLHDAQRHCSEMPLIHLICTKSHPNFVAEPGWGIQKHQTHAADTVPPVSSFCWPPTLHTE